MNSLIKVKLQSDMMVKLSIIFLMILLIVIMFPHGESIESEVTVGSIWLHEDLIASTTFEVLKDPQIYQNEKKQVANHIQPVFLTDYTIQNIYLDSLKKYTAFISNILSQNNNDQKNDTFLSNASFNTFLLFAHKQKFSPPVKLMSVRELMDVIQKLVIKVYNRGMLNVSYSDIVKDSITLRNGKFEKVIPKTFFLDRPSLNNFIKTDLALIIGNNPDFIEAVEEYISNFIKPNLIYSKQLTDIAIQNAKDKIPANIGIVNENERIVAKHDRITPEIKQKIESYRIAKAETTEYWGTYSQNLGKFLQVIIILMPLIIYIKLFRKNIYTDNSKVLLICLVILFISFLTYIINHLEVSAPVEYLVVVPVASMLLTILFDSRMGFYGTIVIALIAGALRGNDYAFSLMNIMTGALAAYTVRDIKNRTQIFRSFLFIVLGYGLSIISFGFERFDSVKLMSSGFVLAVSNALICPFLTYGLIILIERIFKITTDLTLVELGDLNNPVLKEFARLAPGTFNHSMHMGTLSETAAEAIGANPILARVGALYHDIGKTHDPGIFVENQIDSHNVHEHLTPERSVKLIMSHIERGVELGKNYGLPKEILDFIPMHHGTMVISFFYEKAKEIYGENNVDLNDYRYLGPKPNTKETAIVMLADSCESVIRTLSEADTQKIENVIKNLVNSRIDDGQLDNSPLTLSDINKIRESFLNILVGFQHKRIRYPNQEELESTKKEE
jgi:cyclic-di-AMP phosphodiesterase PgpH